jgi:hypothetical protein
MAASMRHRLLGFGHTLDAMKRHVNELHSLNGARNPVRCMQECSRIVSRLREATTHTEVLISIFEKQLAKKGGAR